MRLGVVVVKERTLCFDLLCVNVQLEESFERIVISDAPGLSGYARDNL